MTKKTEKKVVKVATDKGERVNLFKTSYYYYRFWLKEILQKRENNWLQFCEG